MRRALLKADGMKFSYPSGSKPLQGYTIKRGIGVGGFGEVYFAISDAGKEVALKKIQRNLDVELRGVRQCLNLNHVNLISLWDIKTNDRGESWVVMEYVPGVSLRDVIEAFPDGMPESEIKKWFAATASGVAYLHKHGIVHRDLKPGNIFRDDDQHIVKIGDYGLSKFIACNRRSGQTEAVGTFHYMAPEIGKGVYGKEIDIYALGILLFEMLTGDVPFNGESSQEIIMKHLTANVPLEKVPPAFHRVALKSLNKDPKYRYSSVQEMVKELPWRDLATNSETITAQYAMGHPSLMNAAGCDSQPPVSYGKAKIAPIFVSGDALEILREDIVFGQVHNDVGNETESTADAAAITAPIRRNPAIDKSTAPHPTDVGAKPKKSSQSHFETEHDNPIQRSPTSGSASSAGSPLAVEASSGEVTSRAASGLNEPAFEVPVSERKTSAGRRSGSLDNVVITDDEAFNTHRLIRWWNYGSGATLLKLMVTGIAIVLMLVKPQMLLQVTFLAGLFYLVSYIRRHGLISGKTATGFAAGASEKSSPRNEGHNKKTVSNFGLDSRQLTDVRAWLNERPWRERLTDLIGSLLIAALACIVLNLIPFSMIGTPSADSRLPEPNVEIWGRYAFTTAVSVIACWIILFGGKVWELSHGETLLRRGVLGILGLLIGIAGWTAADYFGIVLADHIGNPSNEFPDFQIKGIPVIPAYLIFFGMLFGALRWWHQVDPMRKSRLSLWTIGLCFVWAVAFSHVLGQSTLTNGLFAMVVSTALQLSAPWMTDVERKKVVTDSHR